MSYRLILCSELLTRSISEKLVNVQDNIRGWHLTWQGISSSVDLYEDRLALQAVLHGIDADVVANARSKVTQGHRRCRVRQRQLRAFTFHWRRVNDTIAWVEEQTTQVILFRSQINRQVSTDWTMLYQWWEPVVFPSWSQWTFLQPHPLHALQEHQVLRERKKITSSYFTHFSCSCWHRLFRLYVNAKLCCALNDESKPKERER